MEPEETQADNPPHANHLPRLCPSTDFNCTWPNNQISDNKEDILGYRWNERNDMQEHARKMWEQLGTKVPGQARTYRNLPEYLRT
jgi:hypothetical protein